MTFFVPPRAHARAPKALHAAAQRLRVTPFVPHRALDNGHLQTLLSQRGRPLAQDVLQTFRRLPSGTVVQVDEIHPIDGDTQAPIVICVHGMGGSSTSGYMRGMAARATARGWSARLLSLYDLRDDTAAPPTIFHAGNSEALREVIVDLLTSTTGDVFVVGTSLGGNSTLKLLGEWGEDIPQRIRGVALLSPLVDLTAAWPILERPSRAPYRRHFLKSLGDIVRAHRHRLEAFVDLEAVWAATNLREFDMALTVPLGGFRDAFDYYAQASAVQVVDRLRVPTLAIFAEDDPVLPIAPLLSTAVRSNPFILTALTHGGGHVGFIERAARGDRAWAEDRAIEFFEHVLADRR